MAGRKLITCVAAAALAVLGACESPGPTQDVEFLRGCWVLRDGSDVPVTMMLRLLPDGADGRTYHGVVQEVYGDSDQLRPTVEMWFSRDGRWMELTNHNPEAIANVYKLDKTPVRSLASRPPEHVVKRLEDAGQKWAAFAEEGLKPEIGGWIVASAFEDNVGMFIVHGDGTSGGTIFGGQRDGCD